MELIKKLSLAVLKVILFTLSVNASISDTIPLFQVPILQPISSLDFKYISSPYGWRQHPKTKKQQFHKGIDIAARTTDAQIFSTAEGIISRVGFNAQLGLFIVINHEYHTQTVYGHLSEVYIQEKQLVKAGELIGMIGDSGVVTGVHLHYEIIHKGVSIDPIRFRERILLEPSVIPF